VVAFKNKGVCDHIVGGEKKTEKLTNGKSQPVASGVSRKNLQARGTPGKPDGKKKVWGGGKSRNPPPKKKGRPNHTDGTTGPTCGWMTWKGPDKVEWP